MLNLHLIRHGETGWNREQRIQGQRESELNETGRDQARALQQTVRDLELSAVYVSSAVRTRQTADLLTEWVDLEPVFRDDLRAKSVSVIGRRGCGVTWRKNSLNKCIISVTNPTVFFLTEPNLSHNCSSVAGRRYLI